MNEAELNAKIAELRRIEEEAAVLKLQLDSLKDELKAELDSRKVDSIDTGLHKIFYNCYEKTGIDSAKLKEDGIYEEYSKKSVVTQFKITDKKAF